MNAGLATVQLDFPKSPFKRLTCSDEAHKVRRLDGFAHGRAHRKGKKRHDEKDHDFPHIRYWSWKRIEKEIKGCVLLCKNCHAALHSGFLKL